MKKQLVRIFLCFSFLISYSLVFPPTVYAQSGDGDDQLILGQSYTLESGKVQEGSIIVFGGTLVVEDGARVNGDIFIAGGSLDLKGKVKGAVSSLGSYVNIGDTAVIEKDLSVVGGTVSRSEKASVLGHVDVSSGEKLDFVRPNDVINDLKRTPVLFDLGPIKDIFGSMSRVLGLAALAALIVLFLNKHVEYVAQTLTVKPLLSFLIGLLSAIVVPALMLLLCITLILFPFGILGLLLLGAAFLFGWIAAGYEVGKRLTASLKLNWAPAIVAAVGAFFLATVSEMANIIPCLGWIIAGFISFFGLGAVVMSRFGTQMVEASPAIVHPSATLPFPGTQLHADLTPPSTPDVNKGTGQTPEEDNPHPPVE